ncbi:MAG: hypothetical protein ACRC0Y_04035 [Fusobacteriaceae bacterium]
MESYKHYEDLAKIELERAHGRSTVEFVNQLKQSLHIVAQSLIMLDLIAKNEAKEVEVVAEKEVELLKTVKPKIVKK